MQITAKDLRIKHEATRNPLSSSAVIVQNCNLPEVPRSKRCSMLNDMVRKAKNLTTTEQDTQVETSRLGQEISKDKIFQRFYGLMRLLFLDRPNGWARGWISNGHRAPAGWRGGTGMALKVS